jgi:hypothetical protein
MVKRKQEDGPAEQRKIKLAEMADAARNAEAAAKDLKDEDFEDDEIEEYEDIADNAEDAEEGGADEENDEGETSRGPAWWPDGGASQLLDQGLRSLGLTAPSFAWLPYATRCPQTEWTLSTKMKATTKATFRYSFVMIPC